jgi:hypothetical protein
MSKLVALCTAKSSTKRRAFRRQKTVMKRCPPWCRAYPRGAKYGAVEFAAQTYESAPLCREMQEKCVTEVWRRFGVTRHKGKHHKDLRSGGHGARTRNRFPGTTFPVASGNCPPTSNVSKDVHGCRVAARPRFHHRPGFMPMSAGLATNWLHWAGRKPLLHIGLQHAECCFVALERQSQGMQYPRDCVVLLSQVISVDGTFVWISGYELIPQPEYVSTWCRRKQDEAGLRS